MANMDSTNATRIDTSIFNKAAVQEWFEALISVFANAGSQKPSPCKQPAACAQEIHPLLAQFLIWLLVVTGLVILTLFLMQFIDWPTTGVDFLLKVVSWL